MAMLYMSDASGSGDGTIAAGMHIDGTVPADARRVSSQDDVNQLPLYANAVLTTDVSGLTLDRTISLFGNGHTVNIVTIVAPGVRVSGVTTGAIIVKANNCTVDHCTVNAQGMTAIQGDGTDGLRVLDNTINGFEVKDCYGTIVLNAKDVTVSGNRAIGAYYGFYLQDCSNPLVSDNYVGHAAGFQQGLDFYMQGINGGVFRNNEVEFDPYHGSGAKQDHDAIGFRDLDGVLIEDNRAAGHYYTLKIYTSKNCILQNNTLLRAGSLRTGFYDSNLIVRNNRISGEPLVGLSIGIWINDGTVDSLYENNEIWDCEYGVQESHYPEGTPYLEGMPSMPCRNITLKNNYIHGCSGSTLHIMDEGSIVEIGNNEVPFTPTITPKPGATATTKPTPSPGASVTPTTVASATPQPSGGLFDSIFNFFDSIIRMIFP